MEEPQLKRSKIDTEAKLDQELKEFKSKHGDVIASVHQTVSWLLCDDFVIHPIRLVSSNAVDPIPFSRAYCGTQLTEAAYKFGSIFISGIELLENFSSEPSNTPATYQEKFLLMKLLNYLISTDKHKAVTKMPITFGEADVTAVFAVHLLSFLGSSDEYLMSSDYHRGDEGGKRCPCKSCDTSITDNYGDTSIGHEDVWHGSVDLLLNSEEVFAQDVEVVDEEEEEDGSPAGNSTVESKKCLKTDTRHVYYQMIAQTIVFSFLQRKRHPELSNFLIPSIGISRSEICFFFYDSEEDVLLKSKNITILEEEIPSIAIVAWLVLNYRYFCTGLTACEDMPKAGFLDIAKEKLHLYKNGLKLGEVIPAYQPFTLEHGPSKTNAILKKCEHLENIRKQRT